MEEIWKDIKGYEGLYKINIFGKILSYGKISRQDIFLKILLNKNGYQYVSLWKNNKKKNHSIHRLIMINFVENPLNKPCINHKNWIKNDNRLENLEWCTYAENNKHAIDILGSKFILSNKGRLTHNSLKHIDKITGLEFESVQKAMRYFNIGRKKLLNRNKDKIKKYPVNSKKILSEKTGKVYCSISEASISLNIKYHTLYRILNINNEKYKKINIWGIRYAVV